MSLQPPLETALVVQALGKWPREVLRYDMSSSRGQSFTLRVSLQPKLVVEGKKAPGTADVRLDVKGRITFAPSADAASAHRTTVFESFAATSQAIPNAALSQLQMQFAALDGLEIRDRMNADGGLEAGELQLPIAPSPEQGGSLQTFIHGLAHALPPLPDEAVGAGARWSATEVVTFQGIQLTQVSSFQLVDADGSTIRVQSKVEQTAKPQAIENAHLPTGTTVHLASLHGEGTGEAVVDRKTLAFRSSIGLNIVVKTKIHVPGRAAIPSSAATALSWALDASDASPAPELKTAVPRTAAPQRGSAETNTVH